MSVTKRVTLLIVLEATVAAACLGGMWLNRRYVNERWSTTVGYLVDYADPPLSKAKTISFNETVWHGPGWLWNQPKYIGGPYYDFDPSTATAVNADDTSANSQNILLGGGDQQYCIAYSMPDFRLRTKGGQPLSAEDRRLLNTADPRYSNLRVLVPDLTSRQIEARPATRSNRREARALQLDIFSRGVFDRDRERTLRTNVWPAVAALVAIVALFRPLAVAVIRYFHGLADEATGRKHNAPP